MRTLITETYGGKIDDEGDFEKLQQLVGSVLVSAAYDNDHQIVTSGPSLGPGADGSEGGLTLPSSTGMKGFLTWVDGLPEREPPTYLGLPANAEKLLLVEQGQKMVRDLRTITEFLEEGEKLVMEASGLA